MHPLATPLGLFSSSSSCSYARGKDCRHDVESPEHGLAVRISSYTIRESASLECGKVERPFGVYLGLL